MSARAESSRFPVYAAVVCALLIAYASLQPFEGWMARPPGEPFFLFGSGGHRQPWSDIWINLVAYAPLGLCVGLVRRRNGRILGVSAAIAAAFILSFAMEVLQGWLPQRVASAVDLAANTAGGALGGALAHGLERWPRLRDAMLGWRTRLFLGGDLGELGLTLLGVWLLAQVNPAIPPFAVRFRPSLPETVDPADWLVISAEIGFNVVGVCLFVALLLRDRRHLGLVISVLVAASLTLKIAAAAAMLSADPWRQWLHPTVTLGVAAGLFVLPLVLWLPRAAQCVLCSVALLSALVARALAADVVLAKAVVELFSWQYGQLLNFNGLTHAVLLFWPVLVSIHLFALAGKPAWGGGEVERI
jgi:VanZ family protein